MAFQWFEIAALAGDKGAQGGMGICYSTGEGRDVDREKAFKWFELAADQKYAYAQDSLAFLYAKGLVVADPNSGVNFYKAIQLSFVRLGISYSTILLFAN